jgi:hypothetical protein
MILRSRLPLITRSELVHTVTIGLNRFTVHEQGLLCVFDTSTGLHISRLPHPPPGQMSAASSIRSYAYRREMPTQPWISSAVTATVSDWVPRLFVAKCSTAASFCSFVVLIVLTSPSAASCRSSVFSRSSWVPICRLNAAGVGQLPNLVDVRADDRPHRPLQQRDVAVCCQIEALAHLGDGRFECCETFL